MTGKDEAAAVERIREGDVVVVNPEFADSESHFGRGYGSGPFIVAAVIPEARLECTCGGGSATIEVVEGRRCRYSRTTSAGCAFHSQLAEAPPGAEVQWLLLRDERERSLTEDGRRRAFPSFWFRKVAQAETTAPIAA